jgi:cell division protein FtsB
MSSSVRSVVILVVFALIGAFGLAELRGPQGLPALRGKWNEIRQFEEENANLQRENDYRRDRIKKLESNPSAQELEIRQKLKLLRPGETSFILPEQAKQPDSSSDSK